MSNKWIGVSVGALALTWMLSSASGAAEVKTIAILTPEQGTDFGWNQQGVDAAKAAGAKEGVKVMSRQNLGYGDVRPDPARACRDGASLIIAHASGYNTAAAGDRRRNARAGRHRRPSGRRQARRPSPTTR